jgi:hypothetical protein
LVEFWAYLRKSSELFSILFLHSTEFGNLWIKFLEEDLVLVVGSWSWEWIAFVAVLLENFIDVGIL